MTLLLLALIAAVTQADDLASFRAAVLAAQPGDQILLAPGIYPDALFFQNLHGTKDQPLVLGGLDPKNPPVLQGGIQISAASHLELRDLIIDGPPGNGVNIDDAGDYEKPSHDITLRRLRVRNMPSGNFDGIKLSGLDKFRIEDCHIWKWGGAGIDMVGCHDGVIIGSTFTNGADSGVQCKGGTARIEITGCTFKNFGQRGINVGGSTGLEFFRPPIASVAEGKRFEAQAISVNRCIFSGGVAPIAFVGVDGAEVSYNTFYHPEKWVARILQETRTPDFVPSRNGRFHHNLIIYRADQWASGGINIGDLVEPDSFQFTDNLWYCSDQPDNRDVQLPGKTTGNVFGEDPRFNNAADGDFTPAPNSPAAARFGADAKTRK